MVRFLPLDNSGELKNDLIELTKSKEGEFVLRKYASKLDTVKLL